MHGNRIARKYLLYSKPQDLSTMPSIIPSIHPSSHSERSYVVLSVCTLANFCNYLYLPNAAAVSVSGCCVSIYSVADALADADGAASNTLLASF